MRLTFNVKSVFLACTLLLLAAYTLVGRQQQPTDPGRQLLLAQTDSFAASIQSLQLAVTKGVVNNKALQQQLLQCRLVFKKMEWAAEYCTPTVTRGINGPPVPDIELASNRVIAPEGLQVIESLLFPVYDAAQKTALLQLLQSMQQKAAECRVYFTHIPLSDRQVLDAVKLEVFRIQTLGITGFDNPLSLNSMNECAAALQGVKAALALYTNLQAPAALLQKVDSAAQYLQAHTAFNSFNRAEFITRFGSPLAASITRLEQQLNTPAIRYNRLLNQDAATLFDAQAFNVNAYAPGMEWGTTAARIALGKRLFEDARLSGGSLRSCASCHQPGKAFTDGLAKNTVIGEHALLNRHTPTLLNAALQPAQFYDMRAQSLEQQVQDVLQNPQEMAGSLQATTARLWQDTAYRHLFMAAYPQPARSMIDSFEVLNALAAYVRSLSSLNSRFDAYMRGNRHALTPAELQGFNLFMGKARCGTCHYMPLFNGVAPPRYNKIESEVIGVPVTPAALALDADEGRFAISGVQWQQHAFKTPTVRNTAHTAPYMHNGAFRTLQQVMDFYNKGGGAGMGLAVPNQTLSSQPLHLTPAEITQVIAFIGSLDKTDE